MKKLFTFVCLFLTGCGAGITRVGLPAVDGRALAVIAVHEYCGHEVFKTEIGVVIRYAEWSGADPYSGYRKLDDEWAVAEGFGLVSKDDVTCGFKISDVL